MSTDAQAVRDKIRELYGDVDLARPAAVVHVVAVWEHGDDLCVIRIEERSPKSAWDFFALNLARARADAILVTGGILRAEPDLRYDLQGPMSAALGDWRRTVANKPGPPLLLVLTSGRGLDLSHPALHSWARPVIVTDLDTAQRLQHSADEAEVTVVGMNQPTARAAIEWARAQGAQTISIEAGPSTASDLYEDPLGVDELMLSVYAEPELDRTLRAGSLISKTELSALLHCATSPVQQLEPSGRWRFSRWIAT